MLFKRNWEIKFSVSNEDKTRLNNILKISCTLLYYTILYYIIIIL